MQHSTNEIHAKESTIGTEILEIFYFLYSTS